MKLKCIITDDEPIARKGLQNYVERIDFLELVGVCEDAIQLNNQLKSQQADLLFLDIEMPYMTGIELLNSLSNPPKVIITSAYAGKHKLQYIKSNGTYVAHMEIGLVKKTTIG